MNGFMMLDELEDPYFEHDDSLKAEESQHELNAMNTGSMQPEVSLPNNKKIKPIKRPGLKLQTPIAYQRDTDPNVIPIMKDGMGNTS